MNRIQIFRFGKYFLNIFAAGFFWLIISIGFSFYKINIDWSKLEMAFRIVSQFLPFLLFCLGIMMLINFGIEKFLERQNKKEFLKIFVLQFAFSLTLILIYAYDFYYNAIV